MSSPPTTAQYELLVVSFAQVEAYGTTAASLLFYQRMFMLDPTLRALFADDITTQGQKLVDALRIAVLGLGHPDAIVPVLHQLGERHRHYGVLPQHYDTAGAALLWTLERVLGDDYTLEVAQAWAVAYRFIATTMCAGAAGTHGA